MDFREGDEIGPYRVVRALGRGGMGAVYEVEHVNLGVRYALKAFTLDHGHVDLLRKRFLAEGKVLARLRHPNIARVFDLDVLDDGTFAYFVMDLVLYKDGAAYRACVLEERPIEEVAAAFGIPRNSVSQIKTRVAKMVAAIEAEYGE